jgi:hypothetical protein
MQLTRLPLETLRAGLADLAKRPVLALRPEKLLGSALMAGAAAIVAAAAAIVDAIFKHKFRLLASGFFWLLPLVRLFLVEEGVSI